MPNESRVIFLPADIDRQFAVGNIPDHGNLIRNIVLWLVKEELPVFIEGAGLIDVHLYEQKGRMILHLVNLTNENTWRQPLDELIPVGPFRVKMKLKPNMKGDLQTLVSKKKLTGYVSRDYTLV